jgi:hypothetical protein
MIGSIDLAAALLLLAAGLGKLRAPQPAATMLGRALPALRNRPGLPAAVRAAGLAEATLGAAVVVTGQRPAIALLAGAYAIFAVVAIRLTTLGQRESCGCFGRADSPVGLPHVVLDLVGLGAALAGVVRPPGPVGGLFDGATLPGLVGVGQAILLAGLGYLSMTAFPALAAERRRVAT